jgi:hypothetical protein
MERQWRLWKYSNRGGSGSIQSWKNGLASRACLKKYVKFFFEKKERQNAAL